MIKHSGYFNPPYKAAINSTDKMRIITTAYYRKAADTIYDRFPHLYCSPKNYFISEIACSKAEFVTNIFKLFMLPLNRN